jgi:transposase
MKGFVSTKDHASLKKTLQDSIAGLAKSIAKIDKELDEIAKEDSQVDNNKELIESIPGIGKQTAIALITATNNFETISNPRKIACHAGVVPFKKESGSSLKNKPRVSHLASTSYGCSICDQMVSTYQAIL